jgi:hypothetical protein
MNDITLTSATLDDSAGWHPIGDDLALAYSFRGIFNGNGYAVRNLWINRTYNYTGLFGSTYHAQIKNLGVEINNDKGGVQGRDDVGGIVGDDRSSSITNSYSKGNVSGRSRVGGIVGNSGSITDSYSTGNVSGTSEVGGIAGVGVSITNSYSTGNVSGTNGVGGIAGSCRSITNSYSTGNVSGYESVGGIAGYVDDESSIINSYSIANVSGIERVGGIAGYTYISTIKNNAAINQRVDGSSYYVNRIIGERYTWRSIDDAIQNNFALDTMATNRVGGFSDAGDYHGIDKIDSDFKLQSTYSIGLGWQFGNDDENPWKIDPSGIINDGYPYLYWRE